MYSSPALSATTHWWGRRGGELCSLRVSAEFHLILPVIAFVLPGNKSNCFPDPAPLCVSPGGLPHVRGLSGAGRGESRSLRAAFSGGWAVASVPRLRWPRCISGSVRGVAAAGVSQAHDALASPPGVSAGAGDRRDPGSHLRTSLKNTVPWKRTSSWKHREEVAQWAATGYEADGSATRRSAHLAAAARPGRR